MRGKPVHNDVRPYCNVVSHWETLKVCAPSVFHAIDSRLFNGMWDGAGHLPVLSVGAYSVRNKENKHEKR